MSDTETWAIGMIAIGLIWTPFGWWYDGWKSTILPIVVLAIGVGTLVLR